MANWSAAYLFVNFLRLPSARCIPKLCTIYNRISISDVCQSLFTMCIALLQHTAHHSALCQSGCLAPICMCRARIPPAICYAAAATPIAEIARYSKVCNVVVLLKLQLGHVRISTLHVLETFYCL